MLLNVLKMESSLEGIDAGGEGLHHIPYLGRIKGVVFTMEGLERLRQG